jgi:hypothetical protein
MDRHFLTLILVFLSALPALGQVTEHPTAHTLTVHNGTIAATAAQTGNFGIDAMVDITAPETMGAAKFLMWIGLDAGNRSFANPYLRQTKFRMGDNSAHISAIYGTIESWFPDGSGPGNSDYMYPRNSAVSLQTRREIKILVQLLPDAPAELAQDDDMIKVWNKLLVDIDWVSIESWPKDKLIHFFTTQSGLIPVGDVPYVDKSIFGSSNHGRLWTCSVWYESGWSLADLGPWGPLYQYSVPPVIEIRNRLVIVIPNTDEGADYERRNATSARIYPAPDLDLDGLTDSWEMINFGRIDLYGLLDDPDGDGLTNAQELAAGTKALNPDSDGDGLPDGADTSPLVPGSVISAASELVVWTDLKN